MEKKLYLKELEVLYDEIRAWYCNSSHKRMNIITQPYKGLDVLKEIIEEVLKDKETILYITDSLECEKKLEKYIEKNKLIIRTKSQIEEIEGKYDLIIYDDVNSFSRYGNSKIIEDIDYLYNKGKKIIIYSVESVYHNIPKVDFVSLENRSLMVEPRIVFTRINTREEIPYLFFDYINWFYKEGKKIILYLENSEERKIIYRNYKKILSELLDIQVIEFNSNRMNKEEFQEKINRSKSGMLIIADINGKELINVNNMNIIVLFNKRTSISYKTLLYFCGLVGKNNSKGGEVLIVTNEESEEIDKAREIAREFNKKLWEKGFLRI